jgi:hypothetical protein
MTAGFVFVAGTVGIMEELAAGPLFRFADWPSEQVPRRAAGVYTDGGQTSSSTRA